MEQEKKRNTYDNVFYDTWEEVQEHYKPWITDYYAETRTVCLAATPADMGLFDQSDIIICYGTDGTPSIVTERIFRKNYGWYAWHNIKKVLRAKVKWLSQELGYNTRVTVSRDYIDYIHYKEEWWEWARKQQSASH